MARLTGEGLEHIYGAAERWRRECLVGDGSLFVEGRMAWTLGNVQEFLRRISDEQGGRDSFETKLHRQLIGASEDVKLVAAETLFIYVLPLTTWKMGASAKRALVQGVLDQLTSPVAIPGWAAQAFEAGIVNGGIGYMTGRPKQLMLFLRLAAQLKATDPAARERLLGEPWAFRELVYRLPNKGGQSAQSLALHLVHPEAFENISNEDHKRRIAERFREFVTDRTANVDRQLFEIRQALSSRYPSDDNNLFYRSPLHDMWDGWDQFMAWAKRLRAFPQFDEWERDYKLRLAESLSGARDALLAGSGHWRELLERALRQKDNNLVNFRPLGRFLEWLETGEADGAMRSLWDSDRDVAQRFEQFDAVVPWEVIQGGGTRANVASVLHLALGAQEYPPYKAEALRMAYRMTGFEHPPQETPAAELYTHALGFFERIREEGQRTGLEVRDLLDAQALMWAVTSWGEHEEPLQQLSAKDRKALLAFRGNEPPPPSPTPVDDPWDVLAEVTYNDRALLDEIRELLEERGQVIFQGPPGTGKTFVAMQLAEVFTGDEANVRLVQFHPSYSYEDFVEGLKPRLENGNLQYAIEHGLLREFADLARSRPDERFVLIVDEINRANLPKVFGELFFLLEYRDSAALLAYSREAFMLPKNLYLIGTMNTADRSIALVDFALRRRFGFVPFFPSADHAQLRAYLARNAPGMSYLADMLCAVNREIGDAQRDFHLGHSYFMPRTPELLTEEYARRTWRHSIEPHLEELWYDRADGVIEKYRYDALRETALATANGSLSAAAVVEPTPASPEEPLEADAAGEA